MTLVPKPPLTPHPLIPHPRPAPFLSHPHVTTFTSHLTTRSYTPPANITLPSFHAYISYTPHTRHSRPSYSPVIHSHFTSSHSYSFQQYLLAFTFTHFTFDIPHTSINCTFRHLTSFPIFLEAKTKETDAENVSSSSYLPASSRHTHKQKHNTGNRDALR